MNYVLSDASIIIDNKLTISAFDFESWLLANASIDYTELPLFWEGKIECYQPEEMIKDYIDQQTAFTEFDAIKKGIDRICK